MSILVALLACVPQAPEDVRGTTPGEPAVPTPISADSGGAVDCDDGPAFPDGWAGALSPEQVTSAPYDFEAGIGDILDAAPESGAQAISIPVTEAVVANFTEYGGAIDQLWLADAAGGLQTYGVDINLTAADISPGDRVSFTATEITTYFGLPELTGLSGLTVLDKDGAVSVVDGNRTAVTLEEHLNENIRGYGTLVSAPQGCGGSSVCAEFSFGENTMVLRFPEALGLAEGDCVDVLAPLGIYSYAEQLNIDNNDWVSVY